MVWHIRNGWKKTYESRKERELLGRQVNARFAEGERLEVEAGSESIPTAPIDLELSEEEIRRRVGSGNFESAKDDGRRIPSIVE